MTHPWLTHPVLEAVPVVHGFTTRYGGHSQAPFASLNLGDHVGDAEPAVQANRLQVLSATGLDDPVWVSTHQVHGSRVIRVPKPVPPLPEADGLVTEERGLVLAVLVADCVPVLLASADGRWVGAVHAGWRGTCARIGARAVEAFAEAGVKVADIRAVLGPAIGPEVFEIGHEAMAKLTDAFGPEALRPGPTQDRAHADLWALNTRVLIEAGVPPNNIGVLRRCTVHDPNFFSHRGEGGRTGRQAGMIARAPFG